MLGLSAGFECASGFALIVFPEFIVREFFGSDLSGDVALARVTGFIVFLLGLAWWPRGEDGVAASILWTQFGYNLLIAMSLGYLGVAAGFGAVLVWLLCSLHVLLALLLAGLTYERVVAARSGRADQY